MCMKNLKLEKDGVCKLFLNISLTHSTVTTLAKLRGLSGLIPFSIEIIYAKYCNVILNII
jgi:hypothetical protein